VRGLIPWNRAFVASAAVELQWNAFSAGCEVEEHAHNSILIPPV
jgi:predicted secreted Zn-dependent protease